MLILYLKFFANEAYGKWQDLGIDETIFNLGSTPKFTLNTGSILLTGATLLKLIIIDRVNFTTEQKIISYISIGILLLLLSFFYQKYRERFSDEKESASE